MSGQRFEHHFREILNGIDMQRYAPKLMVFPGAFQTAPADFEVLGNNNLLFFECKECTDDKLVFARLTQLPKLLRLMDWHRNKPIKIDAFFVICFWKGSRKLSRYSVYHVAYLDYDMKDAKRKHFKESELNTVSYSEMVKKIRKIVLGE
jgi:hypothetical protein